MFLKLLDIRFRYDVLLISFVFLLFSLPHIKLGVNTEIPATWLKGFPWDDRLCVFFFSRFTS